ncbi:MAG: CRISPR-associated endonuclease Cas3'', partial [Sulfurihydrogenibium sp.]
MIDFDKILKQCLAKSDRTTLYNHIEDLNKQFDIFVKNYPDVLSSEEQKILKIAIKYHDYGKLNDLFQKKLKKQVVSDIIPHQFLSPLFLRKDENYKNFEFSDLCILTYAILNHHARGIDKYLKNGYHGVNTLLSDIKSNVEKFFGYLGI